MKPLSIRGKFALWASGLVGFSVLIFSGFTLANLHDEQIEAVDLQLEADGRRLMEISSIEALRETAMQMEHFQPWTIFGVFDDDGSYKAYSKRLSKEVAREGLAEGKIHTVDSEKESWRVAAFSLGGGSTLVVAYDLHEVNEIMMDLIIAYALSLPVLLVIAAAGGWWVAGRALVPIQRLTVSAEQVQAQQLSNRLPVPPAEDEVQRLSIVLNAMLARLEKGFDQARRFAADASHELRTPLTIMRGEIEILLRAPGLLPSHEEKLISLQEEIDRLHRITENLLTLARFDAGTMFLRSQHLDLTALVNETCEDAELLGASRRLTVEKSLANDVMVIGDDAHIQRVLMNLISNAVKFNHDGGQISCSLSVEGDNAALRVANTGPGIPDEFRSRLFQRFFRADASRTGEHQGHGLGLSISLEIARAHGGDLKFETNGKPGWTEFVLRLPIPVSPAT